MPLPRMVVPQPLGRQVRLRVRGLRETVDGEGRLTHLLLTVARAVARLAYAIGYQETGDEVTDAIAESGLS